MVGLGSQGHAQSMSTASDSRGEGDRGRQHGLAAGEKWVGKPGLLVWTRGTGAKKYGLAVWLEMGDLRVPGAGRVLGGTLSGRKKNTAELAACGVPRAVCTAHTQLLCV